MPACVDHDTGEAWAHVAKTGDRFASLQANGALGSDTFSTPIR